MRGEKGVRVRRGRRARGEGRKIENERDRKRADESEWRVVQAKREVGGEGSKSDKEQRQLHEENGV